MTRHLILMRHAKSSWDDPLRDDFERALNARGQRSATAMGEWLTAKGYRPDQMLISAAARTRETAARVAETMGLTLASPPINALYLASEDRILRELRKAQGDCVLLIAHNPGIGAFAHDFAQATPAHSEFRHYPTCATTVFELTTDSWDQARFGTGRVIDFAVPRDLEP